MIALQSKPNHNQHQTISIYVLIMSECWLLVVAHRECWYLNRAQTEVDSSMLWSRASSQLTRYITNNQPFPYSADVLRLIEVHQLFSILLQILKVLASVQSTSYSLYVFYTGLKLIDWLVIGWSTNCYWNSVLQALRSPATYNVTRSLLTRYNNHLITNRWFARYWLVVTNELQFSVGNLITPSATQRPIVIFKHIRTVSQFAYIIINHTYSTHLIDCFMIDPTCLCTLKSSCCIA